MQRKGKTASTIAFGLLLVLAGSRAFGNEDYGWAGPYLGVAANASIYLEAEHEIQDVLMPAAPEVTVEPTLTVNWRAGYRLHPHFAAEVEFEWLTDQDIDVGSTSAGDLGLWTLTANAKAYLVTGRIQPFLLGGAGLSQARFEDSLGVGVNISDEGFSARLGGGVEIYVTRHLVWSFDMSLVYTTGDLEALDYLSIGGGALYRF